MDRVTKECSIALLDEVWEVGCFSLKELSGCSHFFHTLPCMMECHSRGIDAKNTRLPSLSIHFFCNQPGDRSSSTTHIDNRQGHCLREFRQRSQCTLDQRTIDSSIK